MSQSDSRTGLLDCEKPSSSSSSSSLKSSCDARTERGRVSVIAAWIVCGLACLLTAWTAVLYWTQLSQLRADLDSLRRDFEDVNQLTADHIDSALQQVIILLLTVLLLIIPIHMFDYTLFTITGCASNCLHGGQKTQARQVFVVHKFVKSAYQPIITRTATRSCRIRKRTFHLYSPGVVRRNHAAARQVTPSLPLQQQRCRCSCV